MTVAYDYPLLGIFWTMLLLFVFIAWVMCVVYVFGDLIRARDIGGIAKAIWLIVVLLFPFFGIFVYVAVRGHRMAENLPEALAAQEAELAL